MAVYRLIYVSTAIEPFSQEQLEELARLASEFNLTQGITGELFYSGGTFMQVLEGERDAVESLFASIERDHRHAFIKPILRAAGKERLFERWAMGLCDLDLARSVPHDEFYAIQRFIDTCPVLDTDAVAAGIVKRFKDMAQLAR